MQYMMLTSHIADILHYYETPVISYWQIWPTCINLLLPKARPLYFYYYCFKLGLTNRKAEQTWSCKKKDKKRIKIYQREPFQ